NGHSKESKIDVHGYLLVCTARVRAPTVELDVVQPQVVSRALDELDLDLGNVRVVDAAQQSIGAGPLDQLVPGQQEELPVRGGRDVGVKLVAALVGLGNPRRRGRCLRAPAVAGRLAQGL